MISVAGIDLAAGRGITEVAVLSAEALEARPAFQSHLHQAVATDDEIIALLCSMPLAVIAVDAPLTLPASVRAALAGDPPPAMERVYTRAAERDPVWGRLGVRPLPVSFLGGLTFRAVVLAARLRVTLPEVPLIEVFPTATLRWLRQGAERATPYVRPTPNVKKTTPAARHEARAVLAHYIDRLPAGEEPLGADLLDAVAAAYMGLLFLRGDSIAVGDPAEGQIIVPRVTG